MSKVQFMGHLFLYNESIGNTGGTGTCLIVAYSFLSFTRWADLLASFFSAEKEAVSSGA